MVFENVVVAYDGIDRYGRKGCDIDLASSGAIGEFDPWNE